MVECEGAVVMVRHTGIIKCADIHRVWGAPKRAFDEYEWSSEEDGVGKGTNASPRTNVESNGQLPTTSAKPSKIRRTKAGILADDSKSLTEGLP